MIFTFFKKLPPFISVPAFYIFITISLIIRFLFSSSYGVLILALVLYVYIDTCTSITPLTLSSLVTWIDTLSSEYKVALLSSSVTIVGFIVAFHTATANWQNQMKEQYKDTHSMKNQNTDKTKTH